MMYFSRLRGRAFVFSATLSLSAFMAHAEAPLGFGEPEIVKLDWGTRALNVHDLNGDGFVDLAVINNDSAQIELLYQLGEGAALPEPKKRLERNRWEPVLEDALFDKEKLTIGFPMFDLGVGDLNGDGLADLAYTARDTPLTIRFQTEGGTWVETQEFDGFDTLGWHSTLKVADVDADGSAEIVLLAADAVRVFQQDGNGRLEEPEVYFLTGENPFNLELKDITGDGLAEICYITAEGKQALVVREQTDAMAFGAERRFILDRSIRMYTTMGGEASEELFASVDSRSGAVDFAEFTLGQEDVQAHALSGAQPLVYPIFKKSGQPAQYAFGDLNGDGLDDLQVANPDASELLLFLGEGDGFAGAKQYPTFSAISSLTSGRFFKGKEEVVMALSEAEKTLGMSRFESSGRVSFPRLIEVGAGDPLVCAAVDLDGDGYDELALVNEYEDVMQLVIARPAVRKKYSSEWEVIMQMDLEGVRRSPTAIRQLNVFGAERAGLMLFVPRGAPVLLASGESAYELDVVAEQSSIRESLLKGVSSGEITTFDLDEDGVDELIVARTGYARAIRVVEDDLEMVDQFNARRSGDVISAVIPVMTDGSVDGLVYYVPKDGELQFLRRDADGVIRYRRSEKVGSIELLGWFELMQRKSETPSFVLCGADRFWHFTESVQRWDREVRETFETDLEDVFFSHVKAGDLNEDGRADLVAVDGQNHVVEILVAGEDGWSSQAYWEIFDQNLHYQGRTGGKLEPRQTIIADLNGDGRLDFAFLIHDRIVIYPQR